VVQPPVTPPAPPQPAPLPAAALVLKDTTAAAWLAGAGIPVRTVREADLPAVLDTAALIVIPVQEVRQPATVDALKAYVGRGGRVLAAYWGPLGVRWPISSAMQGLLGVSVSAWSGRNNATIVAAPAGKPLFNGTGRLRMGRGYAVVGAPIAAPAPKAVPKPALAPNGKTPGKPNAAVSVNSTAVGGQAGPDLPPTTVARWVTDDGKPSRPAPDDAAVVLTAGTLWIGENIFDAANNTPDVRRWFLNAAVTLAPALRLTAKQSVLAAAQARVDAARAAVAAARTSAADAGLNDAQARLDAGGRALTAAAPEMDFGVVLKAVDASDSAVMEATALSTPSRAVEARAVWIEQASLPKNLGDVRKLVARFADARFNVLLPETVYSGRAAFPSAVYPQDSRFSGFDPLRALIDEAHRRGMEVHPWVWTLCAGIAGEQGPLLRIHPEWAARDKAGRIITDGKGLMWLSPSIPAARTAIRNVIREIAAKYDVDGIHLDYARYNSPEFDYSDAARLAFKAKAGFDPLDVSSISPKSNAWRLWREDQVNSLVQDIHSDLAAVKPSLELSASVYQSPDDGRRERLQDWALWLKSGWIAWAAPTTFTSDAVELSRWLADDRAAASSEAYLVPGLDAGQMPDAVSLGAQIGAARAAGATGVCLFDAGSLSDDAIGVLKAGAFRASAVTPWKNPLASARALAAAAAERVKALPISDAQAASQARAAGAELDAWAARPDLPSFATVPAGLAALAPSGPALDDARSLALAAQQVALVAGAGARTPAQQTPPPVVTVASPLPLPSASVPLMTGAVTPDGRLDESAWSAAAIVSLDHNYQGDKAPVATTVRLMHDASALYIGVTCAEPNMAALKASVIERDGRVYADDSVEVFLSAAARGLPYYHFIVGAGGGMWDDETGDVTWNGPWSAAVSKDAGSWTAEIAIPFSVLDAAPAGQWRANVMRNRFPDGAAYLTWSVPYGTYRTVDRFGMWEF
jgi:uncharacterized lipoprotein YddW (UPF0748 family)